MSQEGKQQPFEGNVLSPSEEPEESKPSGQPAKSLKRNVLILGISGGFLLIIGTLVLSSMNRREEREQRQQAVRQEEEQKKLATPDPKRVEQEADRRLEDAERRQQEEARAQTTPLPLSDPTSQQPTLAPAPREDQVEEKPEQPDPWAQARQNFRQQDAQQYYQGIMSARSAPIFFGSGAPSGRRGARAASERSQEEMYRPAQTEEEFYANLRAGQEHARREQSSAAYANASSSQGSNSARGQAPTMGSNESFFLGQTELQRGQTAYQGTPSGDYIEAGTLVHVVLETGVSSQLPGQVIARVAQPVWNRSVDKIVVPAGSKILGLYNANVSKGQNRVQVAWTKLILTNGKSISLANLSGVSLDGKSGLLAQSDEHWDKILTGVALSGVFSATAAVLAGPTNSFNVDPRQQAIYGAAQPIQRTGEEIATRYLDVQPELTIAPGERVGLLTTQDVALP